MKEKSEVISKTKFCLVLLCVRILGRRRRECSILGGKFQVGEECQAFEGSSFSTDILKACDPLKIEWGVMCGGLADNGGCDVEGKQ